MQLSIGASVYRRYRSSTGSALGRAFADFDRRWGFSPRPETELFDIEYIMDSDRTNFRSLCISDLFVLVVEIEFDSAAAVGAFETSVRDNIKIGGYCVIAVGTGYLVHILFIV